MKLLANDYKTVGDMVDAAFIAMSRGQANRFWLYYLESTDTAAGEIALQDEQHELSADYKLADTLPVCTGGKTKEQMCNLIFEKMCKLPILGPRKPLLAKPYTVRNRNNCKTKQFATSSAMYSFLRQNSNWSEIPFGSFKQPLLELHYIVRR